MQVIRPRIRPTKSVRTLPTLLLLPVIAVATAIALPTAAQAQVQFNGVRTTVSSGYNQPTGIALDSTGNVYEIVFGGNQQLKQTLQPNGTYVESQIASGLAFPTSLAIDTAGNIYIADQLHNQVVQLTPSGNTFTQTTLSANVGVSPTAIAVDTLGNLYVASAGNNSVYKETLSNGTYTQSTIASNFSAAPNGIAVDSNGVVYIADTAGNQILVETPADSSYTQTTLGTGLSAPYGVALDAQGNVYIADGGNNRILKETLSSGSFTQSVLSTAVTYPAGLALDASGNLYVANNGGGNFIKLHLASVPFGSQAVATPSNTVAFPFTIPAGTTLGSVSVLTTGITGKDFADAGSSTCVAQTYTDDTTCVVNVSFTPLAPGLRRGAVVLTDDIGNPLVTVPIYGNGTGPQLAYANPTATLVGTGLVAPYGVNVDAAGNIYIADPGASSVFKITPSGSQTTVGTGLDAPLSTAVDGAGNVFIADASRNTLVKVAPNGTQTSLATGLQQPYGMVVDGSGSVYLSDPSLDYILKVSADGTQSSIGSGLQEPVGIAVDASNNLYVSQLNGGSIVRISPQGVISTAADGFAGPIAVAIDPAGSLYVSDASVGQITQVTSAGTRKIVVAGPALVISMAVDSGGNILYSDNVTSLAYEVVRAIPPALTFATTVVGATSTDSPKTASLQNIGNAELDFSDIAYPADFPKAGSVSTDCSVSVPLVVADNCTLTAAFKPAGPIPAGTSQLLSESISLTTNILSAPLQSIPVSGTGFLQPAAAAPVLALASGTYNNTQSVTITDATPGAIIYYTLNGTTPTTRSTRYIGPVAIRNSYTLQAVAIASGFSYSPIASASYSLAIATPVVTPAGGTYVTGQTVTITCNSTNATLLYTTNGSTPNSNSLKYTGPITVSATQTLKVIAIQTGFTSSPLAANTYYIQLPPATPQFSVPAGVYNNTQYVAITDSVPGTILYYTLNGTTPTTASLKYTGPVAIRNSYTLNAIATAPGYSSVAPASASYQLAAATPVVSLASGTYTGAQTVTLTTDSTAAHIHYTTNGSVPNANSPTYTSAITISTSQTLKVIAIATGYTNSPVVSNTYTIQ